MRITAGCDKCGKRFKADSSLVGKRVQCKACGGQFLVADLEAANQSLVPRAAGSDTVYGGPEDVPQSTPDTGQWKVVDPGMPQPPLGDAAPASGSVPGFSQLRANWEQARIAATGADPYAVGVPVLSLKRGSRPFVFPGSRILDTWLTPAVVLGGVALIAACVLGVEDLGSLAYLRIGVYLALYMLLGIPAVYIACRVAADKLMYYLPPLLLWRATAIAMPPAALGCLFWYSGLNLTSFLTGALLGVVIALGFLLFLLRLRGSDIPLTFAFNGEALLIAVTLAVLLLLGINQATLAVMKQFKTASQLAASPLGPGLAWEAPLSPPPQPPARVASVTSAPGSPAMVTPTLPPTPPAQVVAVPATAPVTGIASTAPVAATEPFPIALHLPLGPDAVIPPATHPAPGAVSATTMPGDGVLLAVDDKSVPGKSVEIVGPVIASETLVVVRQRAGDIDKLEIWSGRPLTLKNSLQFGHPMGVWESYSVSPAGDLVARLTHRPPAGLVVQTWLVAGDDFGKSVDLESPDDRAVLIGFNGPDTLLVRREIHGNTSLAIVDVRAGKIIKSVRLPPHNFGPGTFAVSPDGKAIAVVPSNIVKPEIQVISLYANDLPRRLNAAQFGGQKATGLCFSGDANHICCLMEQDGEAQIALWGPGSGEPLRQRRFPVDPIPAATRNNGMFQRLVPLSDGNSWVLGGRFIIGGESFKQLADLQFDAVRDQHTVGADSLLITRTDGASELLKLDMVKLAELEIAASHRPGQ